MNFQIGRVDLSLSRAKVPLMDSSEVKGLESLAETLMVLINNSTVMEVFMYGIVERHFRVYAPEMLKKINERLNIPLDKRNIFTLSKSKSAAKRN